MSFLTPDLTGVDPLFKVDNHLHTIFKTPQVIEFGTTIFANSIELKIVGTTNSLTATTLVEGTDYVITDNDIDYNMMSAMKTYDSTFNKILCKSVTVYSPNALNYQINSVYQRLYPNQIKTAFFGDTPLDYTPELLSGILQAILNLELRTSKVTNVTSLTDYSAILYEEDPDMTNPDNIVEDEVHELNSTTGKLYIHPIAGSFFESPVTVFQVNTASTLTKDVDYKIVGLDLHKTSLTSQTCGVYNYILFIKPIVGQVKITYHAFGGDPTIENIKELKVVLQNMLAYLNEAKFITDATLGATTVISSLTTRVTELEASVRRLLVQGKPTYGDATNNTAIIKKIHASGDNSLHWWNIATLYKVDGSDDIVTSDRMMLRLQTLYTKFMMDVVISVNLSNPSGNRFDVEILSDIYPKGYIPFVDYSGVDNLIRPQFRAIWNNDTTVNSGIIIQFGMELKTVATETLAIEDRSGSECCFILDKEVDDILSPNDDVVSLPNTNCVWDTANTNSMQESTLAPFHEGHLVWAGTKALNRPNGDWAHYMLENHFLDNTTDYTRIKKVRLELSEVGTPHEFPIDLEFIPGRETLVSFVTFNYSKKPVNINLTIYKDENGDIQFSFTYQVEAGIESNQLDLCGVVIYV